MGISRYIYASFLNQTSTSNYITTTIFIQLSKKISQNQAINNPIYTNILSSNKKK